MVRGKWEAQARVGRHQKVTESKLGAWPLTAFWQEGHLGLSITPTNAWNPGFGGTGRLNTALGSWLGARGRLKLRLTDTRNTPESKLETLFLTSFGRGGTYRP